LDDLKYNISGEQAENVTANQRLGQPVSIDSIKRRSLKCHYQLEGRAIILDFKSLLKETRLL
jgi:hypothetical protein